MIKFRLPKRRFSKTENKSDRIFEHFFKGVSTIIQSTESPSLMLLFGQKTGFRARMNEIKSGIRCSAIIRRLLLEKVFKNQGDMQLKRAIQHATKTLEKMQQH